MRYINGTSSEVLNDMLHQWREFIEFKRHYGEDRGKQLMLYLDQRTYQDFRDVMGSTPLNFNHFMCGKKVTLFGHPVHVLPVITDSRDVYHHITYK